MKHISTLLLHWHTSVNNRAMPWKGIKDPYKIWLSEIILQQTRVEQGLDYYEKFIFFFPSVHDLATADEGVIFKLWEGLGYYNRCKNLITTAKYISEKLNGIFPNTYQDIITLKGVGPYTAAAIASFAYNLPFAVVDGNVFRVLARLFAIETPIDSTIGKHEFNELAQQVLDKNEPALYNQAIMDFGATVCKPVNPECGTCTLQQHCRAYQVGVVNKLPVKEKTLLKRKRWLYYFILQHQDTILVSKRTSKDIWENLYEYYLIESDAEILWNDTSIQQHLHHQLGIKNAKVTSVSLMVKQHLTHQLIQGQFIQATLSSIPHNLQQGQWHPINQLDKLPFPQFINQYKLIVG